MYENDDALLVFMGRHLYKLLRCLFNLIAPRLFCISICADHSTNRETTKSK